MQKRFYESISICQWKNCKKYRINAVSPIKNNSRFFYSDLENLSNQATGLIRQEKYDEAEGVYQRLLEDHPEQIDGLYRFWKRKGNESKQLYWPFLTLLLKPVVLW